MSTALRSLRAFIRLFLAGRFRPRGPRAGTTIAAPGERLPRFAVYRDSRVDARGDPTAMLAVRFRLRCVGPGDAWRAAAFEPISYITIPFIAGVPGFRTKLWAVDRTRVEYLGLYEWDDAETAASYMAYLLPVLRLFSEPGSITHEIVAGDLMSPAETAHAGV